jgi:hypothetical protein
MANTIKHYEVVEGNLKAVKDTSDFGGPNQWRLHVKETGGFWSDSIQWMHVYTIQKLFTKSLPVYREETAQSKYELV